MRADTRVSGDDPVGTDASGPAVTDRGEEGRAEHISQRGFGNSRPSRKADVRFTALLRPVERSDTCSVAVIVIDVGEAVRAAGGWMCDRVRAGWQVTAFVPVGHDATPLRILGLKVTFFDVDSDREFLTPKPATLAFDADVLSGDLPMSAQVRACMRDSAIEITIWGDEDIGAKQRFHDVHHRPSNAAQAFKQHAMQAASLSFSRADKEKLRSCAPWYPLDQVVDLHTVSAAGNASL